MANFNYGNSFSSFEGENVGVERISIWKSAREFFLSGAVLKPEGGGDYPSAVASVTVNGTAKVGDIIPAGTPASALNPGGEVDFTEDKALGLTYEDIVLGTDFCTVTIVTEGEFLESRKQGKEIADAVKTRLFGRIKFIKEV